MNNPIHTGPGWKRIPWPDSLVKGYTFWEHAMSDLLIAWEIRGQVDDQIIIRHSMPSGNSYIYKIIRRSILMESFHTSRFHVERPDPKTSA